MRRTERLFAIAEALRGRRTGVTAEELADRFRVSVRTMYRDLDALRAADMPVAAERGRGGGYALDRTYSLPPVNFTTREAAVLLVLARFAKTMNLMPFGGTLDRAVDKVRAALPTPVQRQLDERLLRLSFTGVPAKTASLEVRNVIEEAFFQGRPVTLGRERKEDGVWVEHTVLVHALVLERGETLLNCREVPTGAARQLRLQLITRATLADG